VSTQPNDSRWSPLTKSDLSRYHPLDHWPLTRRCADHYGGAVNHLQLWWAQRATPLLRMNTLCLVGRHHWVEGWRGPGPAAELDPQRILVCDACNTEKPVA